MTYTDDEKERLLGFYNGLIAEHGPYSPKAVSWENESSKRVRLSVLSEVGNLNNRSILDMGCGFGDLYDQLRTRHKDFSYTGIDINPVLISTAKEKYPGVDFQALDFGEYKGGTTDFILSSGALSFKIDNYKEKYFSVIKHMFETAKVAVAFNMLDSSQHVNDDTFAAYSVPEVYDFCSTLTNKLAVRHDYLPHDFTVYMYHQSYAAEDLS